MNEMKETAGYIATKRFLGDFPAWFEILRSCLTVAERVRGEFAGAWALNEAKKLGVEWFPNLRPLVSYKILDRRGTARGGRRAYYSMVDIDGVRAALESVEKEINGAATEALGNAIYRFTFGIIGDGRGGAEGRGVGTGIGVRWRDDYLILTAAHVVQRTPEARLFFLLPSSSLNFRYSNLRTTPPACKMSARYSLDRPDVKIDEHFDLAVVKLDKLQPEEGSSHFYELDELHRTPSAPKQIGFLGYPDATKMAIGMNFMVTPYLDFGELIDNERELDSDAQLAVRYPSDDPVRPFGLSGSGLWITPLPNKKIWTPGVSLVGLVTHYDARGNALIGHKVETLVTFLKSLYE